MPLDDETRANVHRFMLEIAAGLNRQEIADRVFAKFPELWGQISPGLKAKWCWEELRGMLTEDGKASQYGLFPPKGKRIAGADAIVKPIEAWDRVDYARLWLQYTHNGAAAYARRTAIEERFAVAFPGEQLSLFVESLGD